MHRYGFRKPFLYQRPVVAMILTTKFGQKVIQLFEKDFSHFPKFLLKRRGTLQNLLVYLSFTQVHEENRANKKLCCAKLRLKKETLNLTWQIKGPSNVNRHHFLNK